MTIRELIVVKRGVKNMERNMTEFEDELMEQIASMPHRMAQAFDKVIRQIIIDERNLVMEEMENLDDE